MLTVKQHPADLVELFRSAAIGMMSWHDALDELSGAMRARIGQVAATDRDGALVLNLISGASPDAVADYLASGGPDPSRSLRTRAILAAPTGRCITEQDFATPEILDRCPSYRGLFKRHDTPFSCSAVLARTAELTTVVSLQRPASSGQAGDQEYRLLEAVIPALAGVVSSSLAIGASIDGVLLKSAESLTGAAILLGTDMSFLSASVNAEPMLRKGTHLRLQGGRLAAANSRSETDLADAFLAATASTSWERGNVPVVVRSRGNEPAIMASLCPLPQRSTGPLSLARVLMTVRLPRREIETWPALRDAFGLTAAEAAVALLLAEGYDLLEIADRRGAALGTIRNQIKALFWKTDSRRQTELVLKIKRLC